MSIEAAIAELTKEMKRNNELLEKNIETRSALAAKVDKTAKADKPEQEAAPKKKAAAEPEPKKAPKKAPKEVDEKALRKAFGEFMDVESPKVRAKRKEFVAAVLEELGAETVAAIEPEDRARALSFIEKKLAGEEVNFSADDEDERPAKKSKKKPPVDDEEDDDSDDDDGDDDEEEDDE